MSTNYDRVKSKALKKAQQNRQNRVEKTAKQYRGGKLNKTDKQYIAGDVVSSAGNKAWGYKNYGMDNVREFYTGGTDAKRYKEKQKGKNPYEVKYVYDGVKRTVPGGTREDGSTYKSFTSKKRYLTDDEKKAYKNTDSTDVDNYDKTHNYSIMRGYGSDGKTFNSNLNTFDTKSKKFRWDGMEVAKNRVKNEGKSKFNYVGGFLKDVVLDPVVDVVKHFDRLSGAGMGAVAGVLEETTNAFEAIADDKLNPLTHVDWKRPIKNAKSSLIESEKTGWAKGMGDFFDEFNVRRVKKAVKEIKASNLYTDEEKAELIKRQEDTITDGKHKAFRHGVGLLGDIATPFDLGEIAVKGIKGATKGTSKAFKELVSGSADVSMGLIDKDTQKLTEALKARKDTSKTGQFLERFVNEMKSSVTGRVIDPSESYKASDEVNSLFGNSNLNVKDIDKRVDPELKKYGYSDEVSRDYTVFKGDDIDDKISKIDRYLETATEKQSDDLFDYLEKNDPEIYERIMKRADFIDDVVDVKTTSYNDRLKEIEQEAEKSYLDKLREKQLKNTPKTPVEKIPINKAKETNLTVDNGVESIMRILEGNTNTKVSKSFERKRMFGDSVISTVSDVMDGKVDVKKFTSQFKKVLGKDVSRKAKREFINNLFFGGKEVIASRAGKADMDGFIQSMNEVLRLKAIDKKYQATGEILSLPLSNSTKDFLGIKSNKKVFTVGEKIGDRIVESPSDLADVLVEAMINKSRSLTDDRYFEKLKLMANKFGYEVFSRDVTGMVNVINGELKKLDKMPFSPEIHARKMELGAEKKRLNQIAKDRDDMWQLIRNMSEDTFDRYISERYPEIMKSIDLYKPKMNQHKYINELQKGDGYKEAIEEVSSQIAKEMKVDDSYTSSKYLDALKLESVTHLPTIKDPKKVTYRELSSNRQYNKVFNNVKKLLDGITRLETPRFEMVNGVQKLVDKSGEAKILKKEVNRMIKKMRDAGIEDYVWFEDMKRYIMALLERSNKSSRAIKDTSATPLEQLGMSINGKFGDLEAPLSPEMREFQYLRAQGAKSFDELFSDDYFTYIFSKGYVDEYGFVRDIAQHGDNVGDVISDGYRVEANQTPLEKLRRKGSGSRESRLESWQTLKDAPRNSINNLSKRAKRYADNVEIPDKAMDYDAFVDEDNSVLGDFWNKINGQVNEIVPKTPNNATEKLLNFFKGQKRHFDNELKRYENLTDTQILNRIRQSDVNPDSKTMLTYMAELERRGVDYSEALAENIKNHKNAPTTLEMYDKYYRSEDSNFVSSLTGGTADDIFDGLDGVNKTNEVVEKTKPINFHDEVNQLMSRGKKKHSSVAENVKEVINNVPKPEVGVRYKNLPKLSDLIDYGFGKDEAIEILEKMKSGELPLPEYKYVEKVGKNGYSNVIESKISKTSLDKIFGKIGNTSALDVVDDADDLKHSIDINGSIDYSKVPPDLPRKQWHIKELEDGTKINLRTGEVVGGKPIDTIDISDILKEEKNAKKGIPNFYDELEDSSDLKGSVDYISGSVSRNNTPVKGGYRVVNKHKGAHYGQRSPLSKMTHKLDGRNVIDNKTGEVKSLDDFNQFNNNVQIPVKKQVKNIMNDDTIEQIASDIEDNPISELIKRVQEEELFEDFNGDIVPQKGSNPIETKLPYESDKLYQGYKAFLNTWKKGLTLYNLGWHVQNFFQNKGQNYLGLGIDAFSSQKKARDVLKRINGQAGDEVLVKGANNKIYTTDELADWAKKLGIAEGWGTSISKVHGIMPGLEASIENSKLMKKLLESEQTARLHHFIKKLERGEDLEGATKSVNKYLFDYGQKSKVDKVASDFIDPFWTFHKNNARLLLSQGLENPAKTGNIIRAHRELDKMSEDDRSNSMSRDYQLPFGSFKDEVNGDDYDYQFNENFLPSLDDAIPIEGKDVKSKMNPLLRILTDELQGVDTWGNKVVDGEAGWNETSRKDRNAQIVQELNPFMNPLVKTLVKVHGRQEKADDGTQSQSTSDKQMLMDWISYITGNKGNYYRDWK